MERREFTMRKIKILQIIECGAPMVDDDDNDDF